MACMGVRSYADLCTSAGQSGPLRQRLKEEQGKPLCAGEDMKSVSYAVRAAFSRTDHPILGQALILEHFYSIPLTTAA
jgi:hypothetical protein